MIKIGIFSETFVAIRQKGLTLVEPLEQTPHFLGLRQKSVIWF